jgi:hypothetical protein
MSLRRAQVIRFSPQSLSDSLDETDLFPGACAVLQNLVPHPSTKGTWTCRPAAQQLSAFAGFTAPGAVSVLKVIGSYVYGMIASGLTAGHDQPFCYNITSNSFTAIAGVTGANVPATQATTGDWTPPTMELVGVNLIVTHPGFDGVTNFFGWINISNPAAPTWMEIGGSSVAGNFASGSLITLTVVPAWVKQFAGRAYFGINPPTGQPSVVFTDSLTLKVTNANQALTFGDNLPLTAAGGLPLNNQLGGVIQSLLVFKGTSAVYQITGDYSTSTLAINTLNAATGTLSPRSIEPTPNGLAFLAPDGIRIIDFSAHVSDPIGLEGAGVNTPFLNILYPSRAVLSCNAQIIRISMQNSSAAGTPWQEYWFDIPVKTWSGPHTFPPTAIDVYNNAYIIAPQSVPGTLFLSKVIPDATTNETENGTQLQWVFQTAMLKDNNEMAMSEITEMQVKTSAVASVPNMVVAAVDENGAVYNSAFYTFNLTGMVWGTAAWGPPTQWGGGQAGIFPRQILFNAPVVYTRLAIRISGAGGQGFIIGDIFIRARVLGYIQQTG